MKQTSLVPLNDICAVMCNYARPKSAKKCINSIKKMGINEIIIWNNGAKPIQGATKNINHSRNYGPMGKYLAALYTKKPYVLVIDDDHLITRSGLNSLRRWVTKYPMVAQNGVIFKHPFKNYRKRIIYQSPAIKSPKTVDMVQPNKGMMLKTSLYRQIPKHWVWKTRKIISFKPGIFSTDMEVNAAVWFLTKKHPVVVPAAHGYQKLPEEAPGKALCKKKGIYTIKTEILKLLVGNGWRMIQSKNT